MKPTRVIDTTGTYADSQRSFFAAIMKYRKEIALKNMETVLLGYSIQLSTKTDQTLVYYLALDFTPPLQMMER